MPGRKIRINRAGFIILAAGAVAAVAAAAGGLRAGVGKRDATVPYIFTETPRYDPEAWVVGRDRFPYGATLIYVSGDVRRTLAPGLAASADAVVSYDGSRVLFSGKQMGFEPWQIWETDLRGGTPRRISQNEANCMRPLYLPGGEIVYTRSEPAGSWIEVATSPARLSFAPGRVLTDDVLADGRILFDAPRLLGGTEIFTVYPDGTGVEALRCDHGRSRGDARQISSGDYIFRSGNRLARITSALASETDVPQPDGDAIGPIAEISPGVWLVAMRAKKGNFGLYRWDAATKRVAPVQAPASVSAVEPVIVAPRPVPRQFPSALVPTRTAGNLLCLNAGAGVHRVRVYTTAGLLGETEVAADGSFYVQVPADRPLRIETTDAQGRTMRAEHDWFWMRPSEQRICVGCHAGPQRAPENKTPEILLRSTIPVKMLEVEQP